MEYFWTSLRFSRWALEAMTVPPLAFVLVASVISLVWSGLKQRPFRTGRWKPYHWLVTSHLLFFVIAIAVGVFGANPGISTNPTHQALPNLAARHWLDAVTYASIASCGFWIWRMKGFRWFAVSLLLMAEVITWGALFIAGMSVSGDWL
jgi:hypothetical protein